MEIIFFNTCKKNKNKTKRQDEIQKLFFAHPINLLEYVFILCSSLTLA